MSGARCPSLKQKDSPYCAIHTKVLCPSAKEIRKGLYHRFLPDSIKDLYWEMYSDPEFFSTMSEIALHRTLLCDYLERCSCHVNKDTKFPEPLPPDPQVVSMHTELIRRHLESQKGRKYLLGANGVGMLMEQVTEIIIRHFGDQPERLREMLITLKTMSITKEQMLEDGNRPHAQTMAGAYPPVMGRPPSREAVESNVE
jgi:hypothetical protein